MNIQDRIRQIEKTLFGTGARLIPVTKTFGPDLIMEAYEAGYRDFGENRVQELLEKKDSLPADVQWHLIGHLQTNKVKYIAGFIHLIQSVDSVKLLEEIQKQAAKAGCRIKVLLQVHIADEENKTGWDPQELRRWFEEGGPAFFPDVDFRGLMGIATLTSDKDKIRDEFRLLAGLKKEFSERFTFPNVALEELSMGMSSDYSIAVEEGSTMVRMGTAIFGGR